MVLNERRKFMDKMTNLEAKNELIKMLKYFNEFCRENNIKYSLIGGSLIGAIRHNGMIPWDDDIDVILTKDNYLKLKKIFNKKSRKKEYVLYDFKYDNDFYFPFMKMMNINTYVDEHNSHKKLKNYGLFIDIFCYTSAPIDENKRYRFFKKIKTVNSLLSITSPFEKGLSMKKRILRIGKNILAFLIGKKRIHRIEDKLMFNNNWEDSDYVISNWPIYSYNKEIQNKEDTKKYMNATFEGVNVMIFESYNNILKNTFGDYMKLPPIEKRVNHNMDVYWVNRK